MASGGGKPPPAPDPAQIIALQSQYNRYNQSNPFGTASWSTDPNGHETLTTTPSERTQGAIDRAFTAAETPYQRMDTPTGLGQLAEAMLGRVGARYGLGSANPNNPTLGFGMQDSGAPTQGAGGAFDTNMKAGQQSPPPPQLGGRPMGGPMMQRPNTGMPPSTMTYGG